MSMVTLHTDNWFTNWQLRTTMLGMILEEFSNTKRFTDNVKSLVLLYQGDNNIRVRIFE